MIPSAGDEEGFEGRLLAGCVDGVGRGKRQDGNDGY